MYLVQRYSSACGCVISALAMILATCLFCGIGHAQVGGSGNLQGVVTDSQRRGHSRRRGNTHLTGDGELSIWSKTDSAGNYIFSNIEPGTYSVEAVSNGFQTYTSTGNVLEVGSSISINIKMTVGASDQHIEVQSEGLNLQTEDPSFKQTIDSTALTEMPLNGRQITALITLSGGSTPAPGGDFTGSKYSYQTIAVSIAGSGGNTTQWKLDGGDNNDYMSNGNLPFPFPDALSQFSVESTALSAQSGEHIGGLVNAVTRSGTNKYHGSAFEFIRNKLFECHRILLHMQGGRTRYNLQCKGHASPRTSLVALSAAKIIRDKLFAFAGYQRTQNSQSQAATSANIPSQANLAGDFSASDPTIKLVNPLTGVPLVNNQIDPGLFSKQALALGESIFPSALIRRALSGYPDPIAGIR